MSTKRAFAGCTTVVAAMLASGCSEPQITAAPAVEKAVTVAAVKVAKQDLARDLELAAEFRPYQEIEVYAKVSGYLKAIHVDVGDRVRQGQLLGELEVPELAQELAQANAVIKRSELEVERARGEVQKAENALRIRELSYNRLASVLKARPNLVAQQEIDDYEARRNEAKAQLDVARAALAAAEEQVTVAATTRERTATLMSYLRITAPFAGVITKRHGDPGAMIQAGTASHTQALPVVRLSQIDRLRLILPVPESIVPRIRLGAPVEIRVDSLSRIFQGRMSRFTARLNTTTRTMEAEVDILNPGFALMPGMYGYAKVTLDRRNQTLGVPVQAVAGHGSAPTVLVVNGNRQLEERHVTLGLETPNAAEVLSGLEEGELVVIGSRSQLKPGQTVEVKLMDRAQAERGH